MNNQFDQATNILADPLAQKKARETLASLEGLFLHPGWLLIKEHFQNQYENRRTARDYLDPREMDAGTPYRSIYLSGEIAGMGLFLNLPEQLAEQARVFVANAIVEDEEDDRDVE